MLELRDISETDLLGWMFINCPDYNTEAQNREQLEYEILAIWDADCDAEGIPEEERNDCIPLLSPYWLWRVETARSRAELEALPLDVRLDWQKRYIDAIWKHRAKNWPDIAAGKVPAFPPSPPFVRPNRQRKSA